MRRFLNYLFILLMLSLFVSFIYGDNSFMIDTSFLVVDSTNLVDHLKPYMDCGNNNSFVVWEKKSSNGISEIKGSKILPNGSLLNENGITISEQGEVPSICYFQNRFIVSYYKNGHIYARVIDSLGNMLNGETCITENICYSSMPVAMASLENEILLVYKIVGGGLSIKIVKIDSLNDLSICYSKNISGVITAYKVVSNDNRFFISYISSGGIKASIIDTTGTVIDSGLVIAANNKSSDNSVFSLAKGGGYFFITWIGDDENIYGERVATDGTIIDSLGFKITAYPGIKNNLTASFDGVNFLVTYDVVDDYYKARRGTRVSPNGSIVDLSGFNIMSTFGENYFLAYNGQNYYQVWQDSMHLITNDSVNYYGRKIALVRILPSSVVLDDSTIYLTGEDTAIVTDTINSQQIEPAVAYGNGRYLVVWADNRNEGYGEGTNIYGEFIDKSGNRGKVFTICKYHGDQKTPSVYYNHNKFFVIWLDYRDHEAIYGTIINDVSNPDSSDILFYPSGKLIISKDLGNDWSYESYDYTIKSFNNHFLLSFCYTVYQIFIGDRYDIEKIYEFDDSLNIIKHFDSCGPYNSGIVYFNDNVIVNNNILYFIDSYYALSNPDEIGLIIHKFDNNLDLVDSVLIYINPNGSAKKLQSSLIDDKILFVWKNEVSNQWGIYGTFYNIGDTSSVIYDSSAFLISNIDDYNNKYVLSNIGNKYILFWEDDSQSVISGRTIDTAGHMDNIFTFSETQSYSPNVASCLNNYFLVYSHYTDNYNGNVINNRRIWGIINPIFGIKDTTANKPKRIVSNLFPESFSYINNYNKKEITFEYYLSEKINIHLNIYNISGVRVFSYNNYSSQKIGMNSVDMNYSSLPRGVYFYKFKAGTHSKYGKIIIIR